MSGRGLKLFDNQHARACFRRPLVSGRGLKLSIAAAVESVTTSPARERAWIETRLGKAGLGRAWRRPLVSGRGLKQGRAARPLHHHRRPLVSGRGLKLVLPAAKQSSGNVARS